MKRIEQLNKGDIEYHLRSAVDSMVPDVFDRLDLSAPREEGAPAGKVIHLRRWARRASTIAAACFCVLALAGGVGVYRMRRVDSVIGLDVNPSIELSVNSRSRVLKAEALNDDAEEILDGMELEHVDLKVAVNAVIGSMVQNGYLDDLDNAILVTVSNDDKEKAARIRETVVGDIESSLEENQVQAVVYNQQAVARDQVSKLAGEYGISYGKAYFLQELIDQNEDLSEADMARFAPMTMDEIARAIADSSYDLGKDMGKTEDVTLAAKETETSAAAAAEETPAPETGTETEPESASETPAPQTAPPSAAVIPSAMETTAAEETSQSSEELNIKIDYVDFEGGILDVVFKSKVKWRNATVAVYDGGGESYSAHIIDTGSTSCSVSVSGLPADEECTFVLGGLALKSGGDFGTVQGYFETPDISDSAEGAWDTEPEETPDSSASTGESAESDSSAESSETAPSAESGENGESAGGESAPSGGAPEIYSEDAAPGIGGEPLWASGHEQG